MISSTKNKIRIVDDQVGNPTLASDLADALIKLAVSSKADVFHLSGSEIIDRFHFALLVADVYGLDATLIERIKTADLAPRDGIGPFTVPADDSRSCGSDGTGDWQ